MGNCMSGGEIEEEPPAKPTPAPPATGVGRKPGKLASSTAVLQGGVYVFGYRTDLAKCYNVSTKVLGKGSYGTSAKTPTGILAP
jgi:hypothetical protein